MVGGIAGNTGSNGNITNCINRGNIKTINNGGGIVGWFNNSPIVNCINEGTVTGNSKIGGIVGDAPYTTNSNSKIINCLNIGTLKGTTYVGEILGVKDGYGTHYIQYCYGISGKNELCGGTNTKDGILEIDENSKLYESTYMKGQEFLDKLNNYVSTYNEGEKSDTGGKELVKWKINTESGYPVLIIE